MADIDARLSRATRAISQVGVFACHLHWLHAGPDWPDWSLRDGAELVTAIDGRFQRLVRADDTVAWFDERQVVIVTSSVAARRDLRAVATRLLDAVAQPLRFRDGSTRLLSLSVGAAATVLEPDATGSELLAGAEAAMAQARRDGADRFLLLDPERRRELTARSEMASELRAAGEQGELEVQYQPVVDLATGTVDNLEALVRWRHPVRGMVHPASFLPLAGELGLLGEIGELTFDRACRQATAWSASTGRAIQVSVNASIDQLLGSDLPATVGQALASSGLLAGQLQVEISEELLAAHPGPVSLIVGRLAAAGVGIVVDHASGSRASFRLLRSLPGLAAVKLDPALTVGLRDGTTEPVVLASIARQVAGLGAARADAAAAVALVATGMEYADQVPLVREAGIGTGQGFALARPAEASQLTPVITNGCPLP